MAIWLERLLGLSNSLEVDSEDAFDAVLSAYAAFKALTKCWQVDLYGLSRREWLLHPFAGPKPRYPWPEVLPSLERDDD
jgi:hypothetical protein